jgi:hypothetical protein
MTGNPSPNPPVPPFAKGGSCEKIPLTPALSPDVGGEGKGGGAEGGFMILCVLSGLCGEQSSFFGVKHGAEKNTGN